MAIKKMSLKNMLEFRGDSPVFFSKMRTDGFEKKTKNSQTDKQYKFWMKYWYAIHHKTCYFILKNENRNIRFKFMHGYTLKVTYNELYNLLCTPVTGCVEIRINEGKTGSCPGHFSLELQWTS